MKPEIFLFILEQHLQEETNKVTTRLHEDRTRNNESVDMLNTAAIILTALTNAVTNTRLTISPV